MSVEIYFATNKFNVPTSQLNIMIKTLVSGSLYSYIDFDIRLKSCGINLQRDYVWTDYQKQEMIESIIIGRNYGRITALRDTENGDDVLRVIDGKQRLSTVIAYVNNKFAITVMGTDYLFSDLTKKLQLTILNHPMAFTISDGYDMTKPMGGLTDGDLVRWFNYINFAGTPQDEAHRNNLLGQITD